MRINQWILSFGAGSIALLTACAPEPTPQVIYAEPTFNKLGNPTCRPGDVPIGGAYTADLPLCAVISGAPVAVVVPEVDNRDDVDDDNGTVIVPDIPDDGNDDDPTGGNQNQNRNQNENQNQNNQQTGN